MVFKNFKLGVVAQDFITGHFYRPGRAAGLLNIIISLFSFRGCADFRDAPAGLVRPGQDVRELKEGRPV